MEHYDENYWNWHKKIGEFGGKANLFKFSDYVEENFKVIDFGSGGGYILANIESSEKLGVEINPSAREKANELGIRTVSSTNDIEDNWADLVISNHALEHVENPLMELKSLHKKLVDNGKIVFVVPCEKKEKYVPGNVNFHLFTWSEMNLGNLFTLAGFKVLQVSELKHKWPPKYMQLRRIFGGKAFNFICRIYGTLSNHKSQVKIVAIKS